MAYYKEDPLQQQQAPAYPGLEHQPLPAYGQQQPVAYGQQQPVAYGQQQPVAYGQQQPVAYGQQQPVLVAASVYNPQKPTMTQAPQEAYPVQRIAQPVVMQPVHGQPDAGYWTSGICDCGDDCGGCCRAFFCPCLTYGDNWEKAGLGNGQGRKFGYGVLAVLACIFMNVHWASVEEDNEGRSSVYSVLSNLLTFVCICLGLELRIKVRAAYGIQGSACEDCCCHWFCNPCALAQEERHINRVNMSAQQGQAAPVAMVAYGQQQQQPYVQTLAPR